MSQAHGWSVRSIVRASSCPLVISSFSFVLLSRFPRTLRSVLLLLPLISLSPSLPRLPWPDSADGNPSIPLVHRLLRYKLVPGYSRDNEKARSLSPHIWKNLWNPCRRIVLARHYPARGNFGTTAMTMATSVTIGSRVFRILRSWNLETLCK